MKYYKTKFLVCLALLLQTIQLAAQQKQGDISLNGDWRFSLDFTQTGEERGWTKDRYSADSRWDKVKVPHSFSADGRYLFFEGNAWYRKRFNFQPAENAGNKVFLHFDAVFNRSEVWLNDQRVGAHEGGYTPFEFDVTNVLRQGQNTLVVKVNNHLDSLTIPTIGSNPENAGNVGWINYGGITRNVYLKTRPELYISKVKIEAIPDLKRGTAQIKVATWLSKGSWDAPVNIRFFKNGKLLPAQMVIKPTVQNRSSDGYLQATTTFKAKDTQLWGLDHPELYQARVTVGKDTQSVSFGIRKVEVKGAQLLLNGEAVKLGGGNLVLDYPKIGSVVSDSLADHYLRTMKNGGMEFQRLTHYPLPESILDWADKNGMLIIAEAGNWGYQDRELNNKSLREVYKKQLREMIEQDWNHPSVIAYSVGNEYESGRPAGVDWTRDMFAYIKTIDTSRLLTFVSNKLAGKYERPEQEASYYADFICANIYADLAGLARTVDKIQREYPNKPILISEWGQRADQVKNEQQRSAYIRAAIDIFRKSNAVIGCAWWSVNDYYSRYSGSNAEGQRPWGLVDYYLKPREAYIAQQEEFSPLIITKKSYTKENGKLVLEFTCRKDFPSYTLTHYKLQYGGESKIIPQIKPGEHQEIQINVPAGLTSLPIHVLKPTGFTALTTTIDLK